MPALSLSDVTISFSGPPVLEKAQLHVDGGERVCVVGRNGAGKSTLLKLVAGEYAPNEGSVAFPEGGTASFLPQEVPGATRGTVIEIVAQGFGREGEELIKFKKRSAEPSLDPDRQWQIEHRIEAVAAELQLDLAASFNSLSGGMKRRALLGRAIVSEPAVLVLDEPTNHMDLDSIVWLENYLLHSGLTLLFVTHDRAFLNKLATRIVEVELARLASYACDYPTFLQRKEDLLQAQAKNRMAFDKKLAQEEAWLRQGIKARRTRNEGRVQALRKMRDEKRAQRSRQGAASFSLQDAQLSGRKVITASQASCRIEVRQILKPFDLEIMRQDRIGIIGPNGSGKTTLIRLLLGQIEPASGSVVQGTKLEIAYFDQLRQQLDETKTVFDNVADGNESVVINGRQRHVITYLQDFLFTPERARVSLKTLSGGERNRLLLAKLFAKPANLLVLDEPTNDLDTETLELLEELILEFPGTLLLVSHDRAFLDNTITSLIVIDRHGQVSEHPGGYEDWERKAKPGRSIASPAKPKPSLQSWKEKEPRFTNKQRRELEGLPARIEELESRKEVQVNKLADPALYQHEAERVKELQSELASLETELEALYGRWEELETLRASLKDR